MLITTSPLKRFTGIKTLSNSTFPIFNVDGDFIDGTIYEWKPDGLIVTTITRNVRIVGKQWMQLMFSDEDLLAARLQRINR